MCGRIRGKAVLKSSVFPSLSLIRIFHPLDASETSFASGRTRECSVVSTSREVCSRLSDPSLVEPLLRVGCSPTPSISHGGCSSLSSFTHRQCRKSVCVDMAGEQVFICVTWGGYPVFLLRKYGGTCSVGISCLLSLL